MELLPSNWNTCWEPDAFDTLEVSDVFFQEKTWRTKFIPENERLDIQNESKWWALESRQLPSKEMAIFWYLAVLGRISKLKLPPPTAGSNVGFHVAKRSSRTSQTKGDLFMDP